MDGKLSKVALGLYQSMLSGELLDESWSREVLVVARETGKPQEQVIAEALLEIDLLVSSQRGESSSGRGVSKSG